MVEANSSMDNIQTIQFVQYMFCGDLLVEVVIIKGRDFQIIAKQHRHESQFQKLTSRPKLISKLLGI